VGLLKSAASAVIQSPHSASDPGTVAGHCTPARSGSARRRTWLPSGVNVRV